MVAAGSGSGLSKMSLCMIAAALMTGAPTSCSARRRRNKREEGGAQDGGPGRRNLQIRGKEEAGGTRPQIKEESLGVFN